MRELVPAHIVTADDTAGLLLRAKEQFGIEGVSFIGGEPMLQAQGLADVAKICSENGLSVLVFTGHLIEELKASGDKYIARLLSYTDILVDGPYEEDLPDTERDWVGSRNQRVLYLTDRYASGTEFEKGCRTAEIMISDRSILMNGWPFEIFDSKGEQHEKTN